MGHLPNLAALAVAVASFAVCGPASATVASVIVDWSQFQVFVSAVDDQPLPSYTLEPTYTTWQVSARTVEGATSFRNHLTTDWNTLLQVTAISQAASAYALVSETRLVLGATAFGPAVQFNPNAARTSAGRAGKVILAGPGQVTFSVPYAMSVEGTGVFQDYAAARMQGLAAFFSSSGGAQSETQQIFLANSADGPPALSGNLSFGLVTDAAGTIDFSIYASAAADGIASVPEPSVVFAVLTGSALSIGIALRRRSLQARRFCRSDRSGNRISSASL